MKNQSGDVSTKLAVCKLSDTGVGNAMLLHRSAIDPVTYGWHRDQVGWHFVVNIPSWVGMAQRQELMQWLQNYAATIRKERPLWAIRIKPSWDAIILDAYPSRDETELVEHLLQTIQEHTYA